MIELLHKLKTAVFNVEAFRHFIMCQQGKGKLCNAHAHGSWLHCTLCPAAIFTDIPCLVVALQYDYINSYTVDLRAH